MPGDATPVPPGTTARDAVVLAVLHRLAAETGETCLLGAWDGDAVIYLHRVERGPPPCPSPAEAARAPPHCTAIGKLFLAHMPPDARERLIRSLPLTRHTDRTVTNPDHLLAQLDDVRAAGFAADDQESATGVVAFGVPVLDPGGTLVAGLALQAPSPRLTAAIAARRLPALRRAALRLGPLLAARAPG